MNAFNLSKKLVVLRHSRLKRIPPAWNAALCLQEKGIPTVVIEFGNTQEPFSLVSETFNHIRIGQDWAAWLPKKIQPLGILAGTFISLSIKIVKTGRPSLIVAHGLQEEILARALHVCFKIPYIVHAHEIYDEKDLSTLNRFFLKFQKSIYQKADLLIFPETTRCEIYKKRYQLKTPTFITYNCPRPISSKEPMNLRSQFNLPEHSKLVGYWGGVGKLNLIHLMVEALCELPDFYFLVWGWGERKYINSLKELADKTGCGDRLIFAGELGELKWKKIAGLDVGYCLYDPCDNLRSKHQATASNKLMESIAMGVPVVCSSNPDFKKIIDDYDVGTLTSNIDAASLSKALTSLINDEIGYHRKKRNAVKLHADVFNFDTQFEPLIAHFQKYFTGIPLKSKNVGKVFPRLLKLK